MTSQVSDTAVTTSTVVRAAAEKAFAVFTEDMASWWPPEHHILQGELAEMVFEPRAGGRIYDIASDGTECDWASVLVYEPPHRVVFSWNVSLQWDLETDPAKSSEVEVRFIAESPDATRVEVEHRHLDRHGDGWENMRDAVGSPQGWAVGLARFGNLIATGSPVSG